MTEETPERPEIDIRLATYDDWEEIQRLGIELMEYERVAADPSLDPEFACSDAGVAHFKSVAIGLNGFRAFIASEGGETVGLAIVRAIQPGEIGHRGGVVLYQLQNLSVSKQHRNKGIGRRLATFCIEFARLSGATRMKTTAYAANHRARHLYRDLGFSEFEIVHEIDLTDQSDFESR